MKIGDTLPVLTGVLVHPDLSIADLKDATVTLRLLHMETHGVLLLPATVVDPLVAEVEHVWLPGETDVSGAYFFHWIVRWPDNHTETFPNDTRGRVLSIERLMPAYTAVPRRNWPLCGWAWGRGSTEAGFSVDYLDPDALHGHMRGQGSTTTAGLTRTRHTLIGRGRLSLDGGGLIVANTWGDVLAAHSWEQLRHVTWRQVREGIDS